MRSIPVGTLAALVAAGVATSPTGGRSAGDGHPGGRVAPPPVERIAIDSVGRPAGAWRDGALELRLEATVGRWYPEADDGIGVDVPAFREVGRAPQIPAPLVRVPAGTEVRATLHNPLDSTLVVFGLFDRPAAPGVGPPPPPVRIAPGESRELRFRLDAPGTYSYHARATTDTTEIGQHGIDAMLAGAIVVDPAGRPPPRDQLLVIGAWTTLRAARPGLPWGDLMVVNGRSWPHTQRFALDVGDSVRWRVVNATALAHPMHLHGFYFRVDSRGNSVRDSVYAPERRRLAVTETMGPRGTIVLTWAPQRPGNWIFHCHFTEHVSHELALHAPSDSAGATAAHDGHGARGGAHAMAGLVVGITVREPRDAAMHTLASTAPPRDLRLLVQQRARAEAPPALGYVLQRGAEPAPDSIAIPGAPIVLVRGQPVRITVVNRMREPTAVHWHGIELESFPDGVPGWSGSAGRLMPPIAPGDSFVAGFTPPRAGTFMYHAHMDEGRQIGAGLYAPLLVVEPGRPLDPTTDHVLLFSQTQPGKRFTPWLLNGRERPDTLVLHAGVAHRLRLINIRAVGIARLRVHGAAASDTALVRWRPVAKDGADLPPIAAQPRPALTQIAPGEILDVELAPPPGDYQMDVILPFDGKVKLVVPIRVR